MPVPNVYWKIPDDGQRNCPKHVELRTRINFEISASVVFIVKKIDVQVAKIGTATSTLLAVLKRGCQLTGNAHLCLQR